MCSGSEGGGGVEGKDCFQTPNPPPSPPFHLRSRYEYAFRCKTEKTT
jgi:hypothetical protein